MSGLFGIGVYQPIAQIPPGTIKASLITGSQSGGVPGVSTLLYRTAVEDDTPVVYERLNETSGNQAYDTSGNGYTGTIAGGVTLNVPGPLLGPGESKDTCMKFNGSSGYISLGSFSTLGWGEISVECWANLSGSLSGNPRILANSHTDVDNHGVQLMVNGSSGTISVNLGNGSTQTTVTSISKLTAGKWMHILFTWDGNLILLYINGQLEGSGSLTGPLSPATGSGYNIGRNPVYAGDYFSGNIANVCFYRSCLAATDVLFHYDTGQTTGGTLIGSGFAPAPFTLAPPGSGLYGGQYGYVVYTTIRAPKVLQIQPAQSIGIDNLGNPVVRGFPQAIWSYSTLRPDYWYYLRWLWKLSGQAPPGYQYLVVHQYPDQSGNNNPVQQLARWDPPTHGYRNVGAYVGVQLKFTYLGQAVLNSSVPIVSVVW